MSRIEAAVWRAPDGGRPSGENLAARLAVPDVTPRLFAALGADARRHLLVPLRPGDEELRDAQSRGVSVLTKELSVRGRNPARYLDIECHGATGHEAFDLIGGELAEGLKDADAKPMVLTTRVLAKWRRFWGQFPRQILSREEQLGLFAELWFPSVWLIPRVGIIKALVGWRGPFGARHDFEWPGRSVEVKGTTSMRGRVHRINGLNQLAPPENGALLFFSLCLREEGGASNTLPGLVASCRSLLEADAEALSGFESALVQVGYSLAHEEEYAKMKLRILDEGLFRVQENFPRLTKASFASGIPPGIERVEYEINLAGFEHLCAAVKPEKFVFE